MTKHPIRFVVSLVSFAAFILLALGSLDPEDGGGTEKRKSKGVSSSAEPERTQSKEVSEGTKRPAEQDEAKVESPPQAKPDLADATLIENLPPPFNDLTKEIHELTSADGRTIKAKVVEVTGLGATIVREGEEKEFYLEHFKLSDATKDLLQEIRRSINAARPVLCVTEDWATMDIGTVPVDERGQAFSIRHQYAAMKMLVDNYPQPRLRVDWVEEFASGGTFPEYAEYDRVTQTFMLHHKRTGIRSVWKGVPSSEIRADQWGGWEGVEEEIDRSHKVQTALGDKPYQSEWDASVPIVEKFVKSGANDPDSIKFHEWSKVSESGEGWVVRAKFSGKNAFGGTVSQNMWFSIQNGRVVRTKLIE